MLFAEIAVQTTFLHDFVFKDIQKRKSILKLNTLNRDKLD